MKIKLKKFAVILSSAILAAGTLFMPAINTDINYSVSAEESIPEGYTAIYNIEDLYAIRNNLGGKYILMNDIDMTEDTAPGGDWDVNETGWEPIGTLGYDSADGNPFEGIFDGNGHSIIGMNIHGDVSYNAIGLFGCCRGTQIKNIKVIDCDINVGKNKYIGAIVGHSNYFYSTNIYNCFASGNIRSEYYSGNSIGGIVGYMDANSNFLHSIHDCYNAVDISVEKGSESNEGAYAYVGGIVGHFDVSYGKIINCYNIGNIISDLSNVGAVCGFYDYDDDYCKNCYYLKGSCESDNLAMALSVAQMKSTSAFTNWDFENTWIIDKTSSYKYPQLRSCMQVPVTEIKITSVPEKKTYVKDEALDLAGGKILVTHNDGSSGELEIDESMISGYNAEQVGKQTVSVNYLGKSVSFDVTVNPKSVSNLKISETNENNISISWDKVSSVNGYYVYKYDFENEKWTELTKVSKLTYTENVESLASEYKYAVASYVSINGVDYISEKMEVLKPIDLSLAAITIDDIICNGKTQLVAPQVLYNGKLLEEGVDFNIDSGDYEVLECGDYSLTLSGIGKFTGSVTIDFKVYCEHDWDLPDNNGICSICGESKYALGDANLDGKVDEEDANYILSMISQDKYDELPPSADYDKDSYYTPSDAYLIYCDVNNFTAFESNDELLIEVNHMGGAPGEKVPVMIFSTKGKFAAYNFTITLDPVLEISYASSENPNDVEADKNITVSSYINENSITFTGYANNGTTINDDYMLIGTFYVTIPEFVPEGYTFDITIDNEVGGYAGGANDNTDNFYYKNGTVIVAIPSELGDANEDGKVNVRDCAMIASYLAKNQADKLPLCADYNRDSKINVRDAAAIANALANDEI